MAYACLFDDGAVGFDVGTFDTGTVSVTVSETCAMSDVAASVIHYPVPDTLSLSDIETTAITTLPITESAVLSDISETAIHCTVLDTLAHSETVNTKLITSPVDTIEITDADAITKIISYPADTLTLPETTNTKLIGFTVLDTLPVSDAAFPGLSFLIQDSFDVTDDQELAISGFDLGVFDTVEFEFDMSSTEQSTFTKLIATQPDSFVITDVEGVTALTARPIDTLDMSEIERTKLFMPAIIENSVLSDVAASVIHCPVISDTLTITDDIPLLWTGFDAGVFDTVEFDAASTIQSTFTTLIPTIPDSVAITDVDAITKIIAYPVDTLAHSESISTKLSGFTVLDTLAIQDETLGVPAAWTTLITTVLDSVSTSENFYTLWRHHIYDTLAFSETDTEKITSTVPESLDTLESVATKIYPPIQPDTLAFSDIGSTVLICTVTDSVTFTDSEVFTIFANIPDSLDFLEELSTKIQVSETDTIILTDVVAGEIRILLNSWIVDSITLISKMR